MSQFEVRRMSRHELDAAMECAAQEGWNPGLHDAACFWSIDANGFFVGTLNGRPVAHGAAVIYDDRFAFCGLYVVSPGYRGAGYGRAITEARLAYIGERNAGLDGVVEMQAKYERLGYRTAHRSIRYRFVPKQQQTIPADILPAGMVPFDALASYDAGHFPARRERFLQCWLSQPDGAALACADDGVVHGYGVIRKCRTGYKIGPLFAADPLIADALFQALCVHSANEPVFIDIPEVNTAALQLAARYGMHAELVCVRMYLRGDPELPLDQIYGLTSFSVG